MTNDFPENEIRTVGICGIGQMGAAAAVCFKRAGYRVLLWARNPCKLAAVEETLQSLDTWLNTHSGPPCNQDGTIERVDNLKTLDDQTDLVMDCIAEHRQQKVDLFQRLPQAIGRRSLFITTTSGLSITRIGRDSGTGHLLAGTHFWNPPHLMPLVEVIRGADTPERILERVSELIVSIGKLPVRVNQDVPGFIGNRLLHAMWREAINLVQRGIATSEDIDRVARLTFGLRLPVIGPLENMDLVGLDLIKSIHEYLLADLAADNQPLPTHEQLTEKGHLGMKTGHGFYDWKKPDSQSLTKRRDRQIVRQLAYLKEIDAL